MTKAAVTPSGSIVTASLPKIVDVPVYAEPLTTCAEIDCRNGAVSEIHLTLSEDVVMVYFSWAATEAELLTNLVDDDLRGVLGPGPLAAVIPVGAFEGLVGIVSTSAAVTDGLSYHTIRR